MAFPPGEPVTWHPARLWSGLVRKDQFLASAVPAPVLGDEGTWEMRAKSAASAIPFPSRSQRASPLAFPLRNIPRSCGIDIHVMGTCRHPLI